jgi:hypothetical protein
MQECLVTTSAALALRAEDSNEAVRQVGELDATSLAQQAGAHHKVTAPQNMCMNTDSFFTFPGDMAVWQ